MVPQFTSEYESSKQTSQLLGGAGRLRTHRGSVWSNLGCCYKATSLLRMADVLLMSSLLFSWLLCPLWAVSHLVAISVA